MKVKKYDRPFNQVVISLRVRYQMDGNLWGLQYAPKLLSDRDCGIFLAKKPAWGYMHCSSSEVKMYGSRIYRRGAVGSRESYETSLWSTEPMPLASLGGADAVRVVMEDIKATLYRAVSRITSGTTGSKEARELGSRLGVGELVRQRVRFALVKLLLDLEYKHILSPDEIKSGNGTKLSRVVNIDDLEGNDHVEFTVSVVPHYDDDYIKSFSSRFRRRHEKAQYKRLAKRYRELNDKYKAIETKLKFAQSQYESMRSRFMACQKDLITQSVEESEKTSQ